MPIQYRQNCAIAKTLELVGERWFLIIIKELMKGPKKFQELRTTLTGLASNVLSARLKKMEEEGLVKREIYSQHPLRAAYELTQKGKDLETILLALGRWGIEHLQIPIERIHTSCGTPVELQVHCPECEEQIHFPDTTVILKK